MANEIKFKFSKKQIIKEIGVFIFIIFYIIFILYMIITHLLKLNYFEFGSLFFTCVALFVISLLWIFSCPYRLSSEDFQSVEDFKRLRKGYLKFISYETIVASLIAIFSVFVQFLIKKNHLAFAILLILLILFSSIVSLYRKSPFYNNKVEIDESHIWEK